MKYVLMALLRVYKRVLSPMLPPSCRYHPSCSDYAFEAVRSHGAIKGTGLAIWRVLRCNPWSLGGFDPVPPPGGSAKKAA